MLLWSCLQIAVQQGERLVHDTTCLPAIEQSANAPKISRNAYKCADQAIDRDYQSLFGMR
jgi:hypothetical protein